LEIEGQSEEDEIEKTDKQEIRVLDCNKKETKEEKLKNAKWSERSGKNSVFYLRKVVFARCLTMISQQKLVY